MFDEEYTCLKLVSEGLMYNISQKIPPLSVTYSYVVKCSEVS